MYMYFHMYISIEVQSPRSLWCPCDGSKSKYWCVHILLGWYGPSGDQKMFNPVTPTLTLTINLMVTGLGISHSVDGHQGLHSGHIKRINANLMHEHPPECAIGLMVTSKNMSNFNAGHQGHPGVHVMDQRANTDVSTHSWGGMDQKDVFLSVRIIKHLRM